SAPARPPRTSTGTSASRSTRSSLRRRAERGLRHCSPPRHGFAVAEVDRRIHALSATLMKFIGNLNAGSRVDPFGCVMSGLASNPMARGYVDQDHRITYRLPVEPAGTPLRATARVAGFPASA